MVNNMEEFTRNLEKLFEYIIKCPLCGSEIIVSEYKYTIPYYGDILISSGTCPNCKYTYRNIEQLSGGEPRKIIYKVEYPSDVNAIIIKSSHARIEIPELGLIAEPGVYSQGYITTIEGLIVEFIEALNFLCRREELSNVKCIELLQKLEKARNGEIEYTVVIYDYMGISDIISNKTLHEKLEVKENKENLSQ
jgi:zinc finger protein